MPLKLILTLGPNTFAVDGDFTFDEGFVAVLRAWVNAQQSGSDGATLEALTDRLRVANDAEHQTVIDHTPSSSQGESHAS